jgi:hypothetical protein
MFVNLAKEIFLCYPPHTPAKRLDSYICMSPSQFTFDHVLAFNIPRACSLCVSQAASQSRANGYGLWPAKAVRKELASAGRRDTSYADMDNAVKDNKAPS